MKMLICENCVYYDEDRCEQPCCSCHGQNFEEIDKTIFADMDFFKELKKKYKEGNNG